MPLTRVDVLSGADSRDFERTPHWIPILEERSRKLEVGSTIQRFELRPCQRMQVHLLRKKLELLEHATEHAADATAAKGTEKQAMAHAIDWEQDLREMDALRAEISDNSRSLVAAFK